ncbi:uncharacterized protein [Blastocystis hominis]|uniref:Uncharacterized protein n=1 Tax=Blastocystis hominis TaxID=12968 RepID=D8LXH4_BLAHO|nr:uncharacterized protein [Blastocystis hominis]CBK20969.2 unnamed protein product [Blastocystis hominis]|eukprot:XP_012895017.1 uncharacterized protein [Blastocystis hominis]
MIAPQFKEREEYHVTGKKSQSKALQDAIVLLKRISKPLSYKYIIYHLYTCLVERRAYLYHSMEVRTNYSANSLVQFSMSIVCENNGEQFAIPVNILLNPNIINMVKCPDIYLCDDACVTSNEQCPFVDHTNNRIFTSYMYNWNQQHNPNLYTLICDLQREFSHFPPLLRPPLREGPPSGRRLQRESLRRNLQRQNDRDQRVPNVAAVQREELAEGDFDHGVAATPFDSARVRV